VTLRKNELVTVKLSDLKADPTNPNVFTKEQHAGLKKSYERFGVLNYLVVDQNNVVIDGHQRIAELQDLGITETEAIRVEVKNENDRILIRQTLNKLKGEHDRKLDSNDFLKLGSPDQPEGSSD